MVVSSRLVMMDFVRQQCWCVVAGGLYSFVYVFEDLSRLLPAAALLHTLPLHVACFSLLKNAVGSSLPLQHLIGLLAVQEDW